MTATTSPPRGRSLLWSVAALFLLALVLGSLLQAVLFDAVLRPMEDREQRARAELAVSAVASSFASAPTAPEDSVMEGLLAHERQAAGIRLGVLVARWNDGHGVTAPSGMADRVARDLAGGDSTRGSDPHFELITSHPLVRAGATLGTVQLVRRHGPRPPRLSDPHVWALILPTAILASLIVAFLAVRLLVGRLRAMESLAARVAEGDLSMRIGDPRGDEIGRLAAQLDRMAERLATARGTLEAHEQQRRQLFADITHELATPLTSIRGNAETLLDPKVPLSDDDRTRYVRGVLEESRRLDRMIRDLFELARLEAGAAPLVREPLDWVALCRNTLERFRPRFESAGLGLVWRDEAGGAWIDADGHRIEQVLENLLVNALRYVPANGTVTVTLGRDPDTGRPRLTVADDGPGLPDAERAHVFERFYRAGAGARGADTAREQGGSGLGLAIVREIVQRHGGVALAEANAPHGLAIVVELPALAGR